MNDAYHPESWQAMYTAVAGATAALTGLLFIALSLNLATIIKFPAYRARARETMGGFVSLLVLAILLLIPGQDRHILGFELIVGSLVLAGIGLRLQLQTLHDLDAARRLGWIARIAILNLGIIMGLISGISLLIAQFGGLYWLVPTILIFLLWNLNNAWLLLVQVAQAG